MAPRTPERFVDELAAAIEQTKSDTHGAVALVKRKVTTIKTDCGWTNLSPSRRELLQAMLEDAGVYPSPRIDDAPPKSTGWVKFSQDIPAEPPDSPMFNDEPALQAYLNKYYVRVFRSHPELAGLELVRKQAPIQMGQSILRADMLLRDKHGGAVAVELKVSDPGKGATAQLRDYMDGLRDRYNTIRGVLITAEPSNQLRRLAVEREIAAMADEYPINWFWYSVDVNLQAPS